MSRLGHFERCYVLFTLPRTEVFVFPCFFRPYGFSRLYRNDFPDFLPLLIVAAFLGVDIYIFLIPFYFICWHTCCRSVDDFDLRLDEGIIILSLLGSCHVSCYLFSRLTCRVLSNQQRRRNCLLAIMYLLCLYSTNETKKSWLV